MARKSQFNWRQYLEDNRTDINIDSFANWCYRNRLKKRIFDTEQELLETLQLYDNRSKLSTFEWQQYLKYNRPDINIDSFANWCHKNRAEKQKFYIEQELLQAISLYDNKPKLSTRKKSQFAWITYLKENRPDINIGGFNTWCQANREKKSVFDTEQELLETLQLYDNRKNKKIDFNWRQYLKENRPDININTFAGWCTYNRTKKCVFDTEQELLETIQIYNNRYKLSTFEWRQYLKENRPDIKISSFETWCIDNRPEKSIFNTEQELIKTLQLYDNRRKYSQFNWKQYLKENRPDINIKAFKVWCTSNRSKKSIFDTEQELIEGILRYDLCNKYIVRKTKYQGIYNLTERETGLKFNFYKLGDMLGLL